MKKFSSIFCCVCIAFAGFWIARLEHSPSNTITAQPTSYSLTTSVAHDTVEVTLRDTVKVETPVITTKYRTKQVVHTVHHNDTVEVPVLYTRTCGNRKEISPDTLLDKRHPRVTRKVIELTE